VARQESRIVLVFAVTKMATIELRLPRQTT
jgi:hypothetical protein